MGEEQVALAGPRALLCALCGRARGTVSHARGRLRAVPFHPGSFALARGASSGAHSVCLCRRGTPCARGDHRVSAALCALAALVSVRTSALLAQRDLRHRAWDEYRERELVAAGDFLASGRADSGRLDNEVAACFAEVPLGCRAGRSIGHLHPATSLPDERCRAAFPQLTEREYEVVALIAEGLDNHEVAAAAFLSEGTVRNRISSVLQKTGCANRTQLAVAWWRAREG